MMSTNCQKTDVRAAMRQQRKALAPAWVAETSRRIAGRVTALPEFTAARTVLCYLELPGEVRTCDLIEAAWADGKRVAVPAFCKAMNEYAAAWAEPGREVVDGPWRVPEPAAPVWVGDERMDVAIIPGVAFSPAGMRLGHGKGWYDRLLSRMGTAAGVKIGVGFGFQIVPSLPGEAHDVAVDIVVTEEAVYRPRPGRWDIGGRGPWREGKDE